MKNKLCKKCTLQSPEDLIDKLSNHLGGVKELTYTIKLTASALYMIKQTGGCKFSTYKKLYDLAKHLNI